MFSLPVSRPDRMRFPPASALSSLIAELSRQLHRVQTNVMVALREQGNESQGKKRRKSMSR